MANGKHARLRMLNKINHTLRKNNKNAMDKGIQKGIENEYNRILSLPFIRRLKLLIFKAA